MRLKQINHAWLAVALLLATACATAPKLTPLQIEEMQTHRYEADKNDVYSATLSVFQTLGYRITESDREGGLIVAEGLSQDDTSFAENFFFGLAATAKMYANASIEEAGAGQTRLRVNLIRERNSSASGTLSARVLEAKTYRNIFEKVGSALFIRQSNK